MKRRTLSYEESWYGATHKGRVHRLDLSAAVVNLYEKIRTNDAVADADDVAWTLGRIYGADESYLTWLLAGQVGPWWEV